MSASVLPFAAPTRTSITPSKSEDERMTKAHVAWKSVVGDKINPAWEPLDAVSCELVRRAPDPRYVFERELRHRHGFTPEQARARVERQRLS